MNEEFLITFKKTNFEKLSKIAERHPAARSISEQKWVIGTGRDVERPVKIDDND